MAHRTNVNQVPLNFRAQPDERSAGQVKDPNCGRSIERRTARHVLFRPEATFYFCSKECQMEYLAPKKKAG